MFQSVKNNVILNENLPENVTPTAFFLSYSYVLLMHEHVHNILLKIFV